VGSLNLLEVTMMNAVDRPEAPAVIRTDLGAIFVSLELSRSTWLVTSLSPGAGERMSKHTVRGGDIAGLLTCIAELKAKAHTRTGRLFPVVAIQEAGLDGFWIHRVLVGEGIESHVVDAASIATSRRRRRAKTDRIDGEALVRALLAYKRGEPRVCAMVRVPTAEEEDRRRLCRELKTLIGERIRHVNRLKGVLFAQGITGYEPRRPDRRERLEELKTGDGRPLPEHLKAMVRRELDVLELLTRQIEEVKAERDALLAAQRRPWRCCWGSRVSVPGSPAPSGPRVCFGTSRTVARSPPTRGWPRRLGGAVRSTTSRACRRPETRGCGRRSSKWRGCGCGTSRARRSRAGTRTGSGATAAA
jgi:transposase